MLSDIDAAISASAARTCDICSGTRRVKEPGCEEGDCTRCASAEPGIPEYHRSPLGMTEEIRRRLTLIAREAAISSTHRYNYMPTTPKDALLWHPHAWVLAAMRMVELSASAEPGAPVERDERAEITLEHVLKAYDYAANHPHKYLRGTTNWCAAFAYSLNEQAHAALERKS